MRQKHVKVSIVADGLSKVAFHTQYGWASDASISLDAVDLQDAIKNTCDFLKSLDAVPFENMCENEKYVDPASDAIGRIIDQVAALESLNEELRFTTSHMGPPITDVAKAKDSHEELSVDVVVKLSPSYTIVFGEQAQELKQGG